MQRRSLLSFVGTALAPALHAEPAWPNEPVRLVVPFGPGGATDIPARLFAEELSKQLPHRAVVENRSGAGVTVGAEVVARAPKDGHTLLYNTMAHAVMPALPMPPRPSNQRPPRSAARCLVACLGLPPSLPVGMPRPPAAACTCCGVCALGATNHPERRYMRGTPATSPSLK